MYFRIGLEGVSVKVILDHAKYFSSTFKNYPKIIMRVT